MGVWDSLLWLALCCSDNGRLAMANLLTTQGNYAESAWLLRSVRCPDDVARLHFCQLRNAFAMGDRDTVLREVRTLDNLFTPVPARYQALAFLMKQEAEHWQEHDLGDVSRTMQQIQERLTHGKGGPKTQALERKVIQDLDRLIAQQQQQNDRPAKGNQQPLGSKSQEPQPDSFGGKDAGPGIVDPKKLEALASQWGKLPPAERAKAMQELGRDLPARYRDVIDIYFHKLATADKPAK